MFYWLSGRTVAHGIWGFLNTETGCIYPRQQLPLIALLVPHGHSVRPHLRLINFVSGVRLRCELAGLMVCVECRTPVRRMRDCILNALHEDAVLVSSRSRKKRHVLSFACPLRLIEHKLRGNPLPLVQTDIPLPSLDLPFLTIISLLL